MIKDQKGQVLAFAIVVLAVVLFTVLFVVAGAQIYYTNTLYSTNVEAANNLAEAGIDKALESLNKTAGAYNGEQETFLGEGSYTVNITSKDAATKVLEATGYIPNKTKPRAKRTVKISVSKGVGVAFVYGIQVGEGGMEMRGGNTVKGSIYSNGSFVVVESGAGNEVTGDVYVAGGALASADQQSLCEDPNCIDFLFGKSISGQDRLDVAQSFKISTTSTLNKVSLKIKKINNPSDATVRILKDEGGKPDKGDVLATGTLFASLVSTSYPPEGIDVTFDQSPVLTADTPYWLMIDTSSNNTNYWSWQNDLAQSYNNGSPTFSADWKTGNPVWNSFNGDLGFKAYIGGSPTFLDGDDRLIVRGNAHANTIKETRIDKDAYYQTIVSSSVGGSSFPNSSDPPPKVFPISEANVLDWQDQADGDGTSIRGPLTSCVTTLGPVKVEGDVILDGCNITIKSPVWITGNLTLDNNNIFTLSSDYGLTSGVIIVDGQVSMKNNNHFRGTGSENSLLMVLSKYNSKTTLLPAVEVKNNGNTGVFYAANGIISPGNGNTFKELTAWKISLVQNSVIDYETGLSSTLFSSGPGGNYAIIKGTYQVR